MAKLIFAVQFVGAGAPDPEAPGVMRAESRAPSGAIVAVAGDDLPPDLAGSAGSFTSVVTLVGENAFKESGVVKFGDAGSVAFSTPGTGYLGPAPTGDGQAGAIDWRIESGTGLFDGATGFITSNFALGADGTVVDNQLYVVETG